jgi:hypothetical protein
MKTSNVTGYVGAKTHEKISRINLTKNSLEIREKFVRISAINRIRDSFVILS